MLGRVVYVILRIHEVTPYAGLEFQQLDRRQLEICTAENTEVPVLDILFIDCLFQIVVQKVHVLDRV